MFFRIIIAEYCENRTTYINTPCEQNLVLLQLNQVVLMVTTVGVFYFIGLKIAE